MANVYIVKSGMNKDFVGWEWLNLKAFTDYDKAVDFMNTVSRMIDVKALGETEDVDIETLTLG
jgi:hypothetical protein